MLRTCLGGGLVLLMALHSEGVAQETVPAGEREGRSLPALGPTGIYLGLEIGFYHQADDLVSPLRYSGSGFGPAVRFGFSGPIGIGSASLSYERSRLTSRATRQGGHLQKGHRSELEVLALRRVVSAAGGGVSFLLGGSVSGHMALYDHWYTAEDQESWLHAFGLLRPSVGWSASVPRGGLVWQVFSVPLAGVVLRPGLEGFTEVPDPEWVGVGEVEGFQQSLHYLQPIGGRLRVGVTYGFTGLRYPEPRPLSWSRQSLTVLVSFRDGRGAG